MESPPIEQPVFERLGRLAIPYRVYRHAPVFTVEEAQKARAALPGTTQQGAPTGGHSKNLFLRDKKGQQLLVIAEETTPINLAALAAHMGCGRLSFGSSERLMRVLGVTPGSVTPFALLNAEQHEPGTPTPTPTVTLVLDTALMDFDQVYFHPLHNAATVGLAPSDLLKFIESTGFTPHMLNVREV